MDGCIVKAGRVSGVLSQNSKEMIGLLPQATSRLTIPIMIFSLMSPELGREAVMLDVQVS